MESEHEHVLQDSVREALEPDYAATLRGIIRRARDQLSGHPADEIYDVIVEQASADLPGFEPDRDELTRIAFEIQEGVLADSEVDELDPEAGRSNREDG